MKLKINDTEYNIDADPDTPLLWVLRDIIGLTGTKYGCGIALCGACTVHIDGVAVRSCSMPISDVTGSILTIEGLPSSQEVLHPVQEAWVTHQVAQCGYCQSGQIMNAAALLADNNAPTDAEIDEAMSGNLCRCGAYPRIRAAIHTAADKIRNAGA